MKRDPSDQRHPRKHGRRANKSNSSIIRHTSWDGMESSQSHADLPKSCLLGTAIDGKESTALRINALRQMQRSVQTPSGQKLLEQIVLKVDKEDSDLEKICKLVWQSNSEIATEAVAFLSCLFHLNPSSRGYQAGKEQLSSKQILKKILLEIENYSKNHKMNHTQEHWKLLNLLKCLKECLVCLKNNKDFSEEIFQVLPAVKLLVANDCISTMEVFNIFLDILMVLDTRYRIAEHLRDFDFWRLLLQKIETLQFVHDSQAENLYKSIFSISMHWDEFLIIKMQDELLISIRNLSSDSYNATEPTKSGGETYALNTALFRLLFCMNALISGGIQRSRKTCIKSLQNSEILVRLLAMILQKGDLQRIKIRELFKLVASLVSQVYSSFQLHLPTVSQNNTLPVSLQDESTQNSRVKLEFVCNKEELPDLDRRISNNHRNAAVYVILTVQNESGQDLIGNGVLSLCKLMKAALYFVNISLQYLDAENDSSLVSLIAKTTFKWFKTIILDRSEIKEFCQASYIKCCLPPDGQFARLRTSSTPEIIQPVARIYVDLLSSSVDPQLIQSIADELVILMTQFSTNGDFESYVSSRQRLALIPFDINVLLAAVKAGMEKEQMRYICNKITAKLLMEFLSSGLVKCTEQLKLLQLVVAVIWNLEPSQLSSEHLSCIITAADFAEDNRCVMDCLQFLKKASSDSQLKFLLETDVVGDAVSVAIKSANHGCPHRQEMALECATHILHIPHTLRYLYSAEGAKVCSNIIEAGHELLQKTTATKVKYQNMIFDILQLISGPYVLHRLKSLSVPTGKTDNPKSIMQSTIYKIKPENAEDLLKLINGTYFKENNFDENIDNMQVYECLESLLNTIERFPHAKSASGGNHISNKAESKAKDFNFYLLMDLAKYCVLNKLETNFGKASQTFSALHSALSQLVAKLESSKVFQSVLYQQGRLLVDFIFALDQTICFLLGNGSLRWEVSRNILAWFYGNRQACKMWLARLRQLSLTAASYLDMKSHVVYFASIVMKDLKKEAQLEAGRLCQKVAFEEQKNKSLLRIPLRNHKRITTQPRLLLHVPDSENKQIASPLERERFSDDTCLFSKLSEKYTTGNTRMKSERSNQLAKQVKYTASVVSNALVSKEYEKGLQDISSFCKEFPQTLESFESIRDWEEMNKWLRNSLNNSSPSQIKFLPAPLVDFFSSWKGNFRDCTKLPRASDDITHASRSLLELMASKCSIFAPCVRLLEDTLYEDIFVLGSINICGQIKNLHTLDLLHMLPTSRSSFGSSWKFSTWNLSHEKGSSSSFGILWNSMFPLNVLHGCLSLTDLGTETKTIMATSLSHAIELIGLREISSKVVAEIKNETPDLRILEASLSYQKYLLGCISVEDLRKEVDKGFLSEGIDDSLEPIASRLQTSLTLETFEPAKYIRLLDVESNGSQNPDILWAFAKYTLEDICSRTSTSACSPAASIVDYRTRYWVAFETACKALQFGYGNANSKFDTLPAIALIIHLLRCHVDLSQHKCVGDILQNLYLVPPELWKIAVGQIISCLQKSSAHEESMWRQFVTTIASKDSGLLLNFIYAIFARTEDEMGLKCPSIVLTIEDLRIANPEILGEMVTFVQGMKSLALLEDEKWYKILFDANEYLKTRFGILYAKIKSLLRNLYAIDDVKKNLWKIDKNLWHGIESAFHAATAPIIWALKCHLYEIEQDEMPSPYNRTFLDKSNMSERIALLVDELSQFPRYPSDKKSKDGLLENILQKPLKSVKSLIMEIEAHLQKRHRMLSLSMIAPSITKLDFQYLRIPSAPDASILKISDEVLSLDTKNRPKKITLNLSYSGFSCEEQSYLIKGGQDMHVQEAVTSFISAAGFVWDPHNHCIDLPHIIPLGPTIGMVRWLDDCASLYDLYWMREIHRLECKKTLDSLKHDSTKTEKILAKAKPLKQRKQKKVKEEAKGSSERLDGNQKIIKEFDSPIHPVENFKIKLRSYGIHPGMNRKEWPSQTVLRVFKELSSEVPASFISSELLINASCPAHWWQNASNFSASCAGMSVLGHILGIGDRHLDNILLNVVNGKMIHIDFDILFGQGATLAIPELVPFRMTQSIINGLGIGGINGKFKTLCKEIMTICSSNPLTFEFLIEEANSRYTKSKLVGETSQTTVWNVVDSGLLVRKLIRNENFESCKSALDVLKKVGNIMQAYVHIFYTTANALEAFEESKALFTECSNNKDDSFIKEKTHKEELKKLKKSVEDLNIQFKALSESVLNEYLNSKYCRKKHHDTLNMVEALADNNGYYVHDRNLESGMTEQNIEQKESILKRMNYFLFSGMDEDLDVPQISSYLPANLLGFPPELFHNAQRADDLGSNAITYINNTIENALHLLRIYAKALKKLGGAEKYSLTSSDAIWERKFSSLLPLLACEFLSPESSFSCQIEENRYSSDTAISTSLGSQGDGTHNRMMAEVCLRCSYLLEEKLAYRVRNLEQRNTEISFKSEELKRKILCSAKECSLSDILEVLRRFFENYANRVQEQKMSAEFSGSDFLNNLQSLVLGFATTLLHTIESEIVNFQNKIRLSDIIRIKSSWISDSVHCVDIISTTAGNMELATVHIVASFLCPSERIVIEEFRDKIRYVLDSFLENKVVLDLEALESMASNLKKFMSDIATRWEYGLGLALQSFETLISNLNHLGFDDLETLDMDDSMQHHCHMYMKIMSEVHVLVSQITNGAFLRELVSLLQLCSFYLDLCDHMEVAYRNLSEMPDSTSKSREMLDEELESHPGSLDIGTFWEEINSKINSYLACILQAHFLPGMDKYLHNFIIHIAHDACNLDPSNDSNGILVSSIVQTQSRPGTSAELPDFFDFMDTTEETFGSTPMTFDDDATASLADMGSEASMVSKTHTEESLGKMGKNCDVSLGQHHGHLCFLSPELLMESTESFGEMAADSSLKFVTNLTLSSLKSEIDKMELNLWTIEWQTERLFETNSNGAGSRQHVGSPFAERTRSSISKMSHEYRSDIVKSFKGGLDELSAAHVCLKQWKDLRESVVAELTTNFRKSLDSQFSPFIETLEENTNEWIDFQDERITVFSQLIQYILEFEISRETDEDSLRRTVQFLGDDFLPVARRLARYEELLHAAQKVCIGLEMNRNKEKETEELLSSVISSRKIAQDKIKKIQITERELDESLKEDALQLVKSTRGIASELEALEPAIAESLGFAASSLFSVQYLAGTMSQKTKDTNSSTFSCLSKVIGKLHEKLYKLNAYLPNFIKEANSIQRRLAIGGRGKEAAKEQSKDIVKSLKSMVEQIKQVLECPLVVDKDHSSRNDELILIIQKALDEAKSKYEDMYLCHGVDPACVFGKSLSNEFQCRSKRKFQMSHFRSARALYPSQLVQSFRKYTDADTVHEFQAHSDLCDFRKKLAFAGNGTEMHDTIMGKIEELLVEATSISNLSHMYEGWMPWI